MVHAFPSPTSVWLDSSGPDRVVATASAATRWAHSEHTGDHGNSPVLLTRAGAAGNRLQDLPFAFPIGTGMPVPDVVEGGQHRQSRWSFRDEHERQRSGGLPPSPSDA
ncbi:hypothetical protein DCS_00229 [Drechmeria coniospora]|uniref:Uncharacterized protein n=1 Tax=Drechmeria coniospora TaxID=98403 RepID=A0A151GPW6_DRECN|nr:hypothetical protein DCS_00229 [Drechmeria coniospora]KYK59101.1 hypothetical protein DCS_00229 [Drechmeria coniospora]